MFLVHSALLPDNEHLISIVTSASNGQESLASCIHSPLRYAWKAPCHVIVPQGVGESTGRWERLQVNILNSRAPLISLVLLILKPWPRRKDIPFFLSIISFSHLHPSLLESSFSYTAKMAPLSSLLCASLAFAGTAIASSLSPIYPRQNSTTPDCPGYRATDVKTTANGLSAKLTLAGNPCNVFGTDLEDLTLTVEYQTGESIHTELLLRCADKMHCH